MPQIAQQDYLYIKPEIAVVVGDDAAALGQLKRAMDNGTISDCLVCVPAYLAGGVTEQNLSKVLSYSPESGRILCLDSLNQQRIIYVVYSQQQYEGLAAIQKGENEKGYEVPALPSLISVNEYLQDDETSAYICVEGKYLIGYTDDNDNLEKIVKSDVDAEGRFVNITWEDAQKLIGLPI